MLRALLMCFLDVHGAAGLQHSYVCVQAKPSTVPYRSRSASNSCMPPVPCLANGPSTPGTARIACQRARQPAAVSNTSASAPQAEQRSQRESK
jgi:hypothetical protein